MNIQQKLRDVNGVAGQKDAELNNWRATLEKATLAIRQLEQELSNLLGQRTILLEMQEEDNTQKKKEVDMAKTDELKKEAQRVLDKNESENIPKQEQKPLEKEQKTEEKQGQKPQLPQVASRPTPQTPAQNVGG